MSDILQLVQFLRFYGHGDIYETGFYISFVIYSLISIIIFFLYMSVDTKIDALNWQNYLFCVMGMSIPYHLFLYLHCSGECFDMLMIWALFTFLSSLAVIFRFWYEKTRIRNRRSSKK